MGTTGKRIALGLDIGGTKLKAIAIDDSYSILSEFQTDSAAAIGPNSVRESLHRSVEYFRSQNIFFSCMGLGCAGSVDPRTGVVRNSPNFGNWKDVPLRDWMESDYGVPVVIDNDANCAVFTEWKLGSAIGFRNIVLLTLGTGIGGGIILNGHLFRGATGTGGELGHMSIYANGKPCSCGNRGCFERYCSATAIKERAGNFTPAKEIFSRSHEPFFSQIIDQYLEDFQIGLTSLANVFDPEVILLGGAMSEGVSRYIAKIQSWVRQHAFPSVGERIQIRPSRYGNFSGSLGAALLSLEEYQNKGLLN